MRSSDWSSDVCSSDLDHTSYSYSLEADAGNASKINLDELSLEGVDLTEPGQITPLAPAAVGGGGNVFALTGRFEPDGTEDQEATESTRSEEHTSELQSLMRISYAVFCLKKKNKQ